MDILDIKSLLNQKNIQNLNDDIKDILSKNKEQAVMNNKENEANEIWCLEQIYDVKVLYNNAFNFIKDKKHYDAWCIYEIINNRLIDLRKHFNYENNEYNLNFIETYSRKFQKLFPYKIFTSREVLIKKKVCSICGEKESIRNSCGHDVGELYMGEICYRVVKEFEFVAIAIVHNPHNKYAVLTPEDKEYSYEMLDTLFGSLRSPYVEWEVAIKQVKRIEFQNAERNKNCPCNSGNKYKRCCYGKETELREHYKFVIYDRNVKSVPYKLISMWK